MLLTILLTVNLLSQYRYYVEEVCELYPIQTEFVEAVIETESSWNADAESSCGAIGLMQVMPKWHEERMKKLEVTDLKNPYQNILTGCDYLNELFEIYEDPAKVLMVYNMGQNGAELFDQGIISAYAQKILSRTEELEEEHGKKDADGTDSNITESADRVQLRTTEGTAQQSIESVQQCNLYRGIEEGSEECSSESSKREETVYRQSEGHKSRIYEALRRILFKGRRNS